MRPPRTWGWGKPFRRISQRRHRDTEDRGIERLRDRAIVKKLCVIASVLVASVLVVLCFYAPGAALARSCLPPTMDEAAIKNAAVIFEGVAGHRRALSRAETAVPECGGMARRSGGISCFADAFTAPSSGTVRLMMPGGQIIHASGASGPALLFPWWLGASGSRHI